MPQAQAQDSQAQDKSAHAWELMQAIKIASFVTHDGHGDNLRARPVHAHPVPADNAIYFLTNADAAKTGEVDRNQNVCVAFADTKSQNYVSVTGVAAVSNDRAKIKELWTASDKAFWDDANDPSIRLIRVTPSVAEYWDNFGTVVAAVKIVFSSLTGSKPDLGENEKVDLARTSSR